MKKFYYTKSYLPSLKSYHKISGNIFTIKRGQLVLCCEYEFSTGASRGEVSEVFQTLVENGFIPKKWLKSDDGYFQGEVTNFYNLICLEDIK